MRRGELYRVRRPPSDPRPARVFLVVGRQAVIDSRLSAVVCAPVHSEAEGLSTQVRVGVEEGLRHESWILCDVLTSVPKTQLTDFVGSLSTVKLAALREALRIALHVD